jgi:hypothetical protein
MIEDRRATPRDIEREMKMEDRKMIELKVSGVWCDVCGDNNEWGFEALGQSPMGRLVRCPVDPFELVRLSVCQRCARQHDQIDVRLQESVARLVEESDRRRSAGLDQQADYVDEVAARLRYWIGRIKAPSDADWKALKDAKIEADVQLAWLLESEGLPAEPPEAEAV